jgi:carboxypeptidase T
LLTNVLLRAVGFPVVATLVFAIGGPSAGAATGGQAKSLVRVPVGDAEARVRLWRTLPDWDVAGTVDAGRSLDLVVTAVERDKLAAGGVAFEVVIEDVEQAADGVRAVYHTFPEMESLLGALAADYPAITQLTSLGLSYEGRSIWCLEISDNPGADEGEPGLVFVGLHHAREWPGVEMGLEIATRLTSNYGSDPTITDLVDNRRIWVIPCLNPDGYVYCHDQGHDWRKNRHVFPLFGTVGVDLNRNYDGACNGDKGGAWGSVGPGLSTHNPSSEAYCGLAPFSELETQAMRGLLAANRVAIAVTYHTYGQLVLWPWGYTAQTAPDNSLLVSTGQALASAIGGYTPKQSYNDYGTIAEMIDWDYGYGFYELGENTLPYTIEMGLSFQPSEAQLQAILDANWLGALYLMQQAPNVLSEVTPFVLPPVLSTPATDGDGNFTVSWQQQNPDAGADHYALQELTGLSELTDGAESGTGAWVMQGMTITTTRYHWGTHSFASPTGNSQIAAMTTVAPLPVAAGDQLSFWVWYDLQTRRDMAFVEVSADGRKYDMLGAFTGQSSVWVQKTYSLASYVGQSIYIRFRYTTDPSTTGQGFYVDDIYPVAAWGNIVTLGSNITDTSFDITGRTPGDYYYRVRGSNVAHGWGDYCALSMTHVETNVLSGDLNCDGTVDFGDINPFVLILADPAAWQAAHPDCPWQNGDINGDGTVDFADINPFVGLLTGG